MCERRHFKRHANTTDNVESIDFHHVIGCVISLLLPRLNGRRSMRHKGSKLLFDTPKGALVPLYIPRIAAHRGNIIECETYIC